MCVLQISSTHSLDALKECALVDMVLQGNPLKDRLKDDTVYVRYQKNWVIQGNG